MPSKPQALLALFLCLSIGLGACRGLSPAEPESADGSSSPTESDAAALPGDVDASEDAASEAAPGEAAAGADASTPSDAVASVNGELLTLAAFQRQAFDTQRYHVDQGGIDPNTDEGQRKLLFLRRQVLNDMIDQMLIEQAAAELGIRAEDDEVEASLADFVEELGGEAAFEASLEEAGTTREDVIAMERSSLIGRKMLDVIAVDVPETAEFVHARHILCSSADACEAARQRIESGEAFETVAGEVSEDETSRERGGDLDWVAPGMLLSSQLEEAIFALEAGTLSPVIQTDLGYHVVELLERDAARTLPDAQRAQLKERALLEWLSDRRSSADIQIYVEDLRAPADEAVDEG